MTLSAANGLVAPAGGEGADADGPEVLAGLLEAVVVAVEDDALREAAVKHSRQLGTLQPKSTRQITRLGPVLFGQLGGYPRVWVANKKHGSYRSMADCNDGGELGWDDCSYNVDDDRVEVSPYRNLGSAAFPFLNCVASENPLSYPGLKCFWYDDPEYRFCGWDLDRTDCASAYYQPFASAGFAYAVEQFRRPGKEPFHASPAGRVPAASLWPCHRERAGAGRRSGSG